MAMHEITSAVGTTFRAVSAQKSGSWSRLPMPSCWDMMFARAACLRDLLASSQATSCSSNCV